MNTEDQVILAALVDPIDAEAFRNLMAHAHERGMSAADFVREEPDRTSRKSIRSLCLRGRKRTFGLAVRSGLKRLFGAGSADTEARGAVAIYGPSAWTRVADARDRDGRQGTP